MNKRIWCAISGHGFGHLSQVIPILKQLAKTVSLTIHISTPLPHTLIQKNLEHPFSQECRSQDVGLVQNDPMVVDLPKTFTALKTLHDNWDTQLHLEKQALAQWKPDLVLADIPYIPIAAAAELSIPSVAIASLTWDAVLSAYFSSDIPEVHLWLHQMRQAYAQTTLALMPTPTLPGDIFPNRIHIPPLTTPGYPQKDRLRHTLGIDPKDKKPLILVSLGGFPAQNLPLENLAEESRFHWLIDLSITKKQNHLHTTQTLFDWNFSDIIASVDGIVSKPGYGTSVLASVHQQPFLYICRGLFPDEKIICDWLKKVGRSSELTPEIFYTGKWHDPLQQLMDQPPPPPPPSNGAQTAARILCSHFLN